MGSQGATTRVSEPHESSSVVSSEEPLDHRRSDHFILRPLPTLEIDGNQT